MKSCLVCLRPKDGMRRYHAKCVKALFGSPRLPQPVDIDIARLHTAGLAMVGRTTLSGIQRKISVNLSSDRHTLQVAMGPSRYILKPQTSTYPELPENELVTMRIVQLAGVDIPACGLMALTDGSMAYVVRRFNRLDTGRKLHQEDFCQLAGFPSKRKYEGSAELCARLVGQYATEPGIERLKLFRQMLACWWTGNGDAHLKNFSLLTDAAGVTRLSPAYDQLCTRLVLPDDQLALPVNGKRDGLRRKDWEGYGSYCDLPPKTIERELQRVAAAVDDAVDLLLRSPIENRLGEAYIDLLRARSSVLRAD